MPPTRPHASNQVSEIIMLQLYTMTIADVAIIKQWPPYPPDMAELDYALRDHGWLDECFGQPAHLCLTAWHDSTLIGFSMLLHINHSAEFRIALKADQVGKGWGEAITRQILELGFTHLHLNVIKLIVRENHLRAQRLYKKLGFQETGRCTQPANGKDTRFVEMEILQSPNKQFDGKPDTPIHVLIDTDVQLKLKIPS